MSEERDECRERFEAHAPGVLDLQRVNLKRDGDGYHFEAAQKAWDLWQAAWNAREEWRPIAEAPRDGTHMQLYRPEIQFVGYWATKAKCWCINAPGLPVMEPPPTHFRPLPEPPNLNENE